MRRWLVAVVLALSCGREQARPQGGSLPMRDLAHFRLLTKDSTVAEVKRQVGEPDGDLGSGIYM
jgi:hypothetical protein